MSFSNTQSSLRLSMIHGLHLQHAMPLVLVMSAFIASCIHCQLLSGHKTGMTSAEIDSLMTKTKNYSLEQPDMMTATESAAKGTISPPHHSRMLSTLPSMVIPYGRMNFQKHQLKMMATGDPGYHFLDEFGKETTIPFGGGLLNITNCVNGEYIKTYNISSVSKRALMERLFRIPDDIHNITGEKIGITDQRKTEIVVLICYPSVFLNLSIGSVNRVAAHPDQCLNSSVHCGKHTTEQYPPYMCLGHEMVSQDECDVFMSVPSRYQNYTGMAQQSILGSQSCDESINVTYSKTNGINIPLIPGTLIMMMIGDVEVHLYAGRQYSIFCKIITKENRSEYDVSGIKGVKINPGPQLISSGIVRVDCNIVDNISIVIASTYLFIADGMLKVDEECKDGKPSCSLPTWFSDYINKPVIHYGTGEGLPCTAKFTSCFPKIDIHTMSSGKVTGPSCMTVETAKHKSEQEDGIAANKLVIVILGVITLMLLIGNILGMLYSRVLKRARKLNKLSDIKMMKDEEEHKMAGTDTGSEVGSTEDLFSQDDETTASGSTLKEDEASKTISAADILNEKDDIPPSKRKTVSAADILNEKDEMPASKRKNVSAADELNEKDDMASVISQV